MKRLAFALVALVALTACGDDSGGGAADAAATADAPPADAAAPADAAGCTSSGGPGGTHKLFLAFDGVDMIPSADGKNHSATNEDHVLAAPATVPAFLAGQAGRDVAIAGIVAQVKATLGPYDVEVVTTRPAATPYVMIVFGGTSENVNRAVGGSAAFSFDCNNSDDDDVGYVFDAAFTAFTATGAANEAVRDLGAALGLDLDTTSGDCMCSSASSCGFADAACSFGTQPVASTPAPVCHTAGDAQDEARELQLAFGCRP